MTSLKCAICEKSEVADKGLNEALKGEYTKSWLQAADSVEDLQHSWPLCAPSQGLIHRRYCAMM